MDPEVAYEIIGLLFDSVELKLGELKLGGYVLLELQAGP